MAKFNGTASSPSSNNTDRLSQLEKEMRYERRRKIIESDFSDKLTMLSEYTGLVSNRHEYPESAVIDPETQAIFDSRVFNPPEVAECFFRLESMCQQIKVFCPALNDTKKQELYNLMNNLDAIRNSLTPYYNSMVKALGNNNQKKQRNDRQVGGIGINSAMFGGR